MPNETNAMKVDSEKIKDKINYFSEIIEGERSI